MQKPQLMPSRDAVTNFQVATVLGIVQTMGSFLVQPEVDPANPHRPGGSMDGGPRASAEVTFTKACEKLDSILEDKSRWDLEIQRLLELQLAKLMNEQRVFLAAQTAASLALNTPAYMYQPQIIHTGEEYVALLGDPENPACIGIGNSPAEACADFNRAFQGEVTESQLKWIENHPEPEPTPKPKSKLKKK